MTVTTIFYYGPLDVRARGRVTLSGLASGACTGTCGIAQPVFPVTVSGKAHAYAGTIIGYAYAEGFVEMFGDAAATVAVTGTAAGIRTAYATAAATVAVTGTAAGYIANVAACTILVTGTVDHTWATRTFYASTADGVLYSSDAVYATAVAGAGAAADTATGTSGFLVGQNTGYRADQSFISFDTSAIPDGDTITTAPLSLWLSVDETASGQEITVSARIYDWGATLTGADWRNPTQAGALTEVATLASGGLGAVDAYYAFTDVALPANVSKTGTTYIALFSDRFISSTVPTVLERLRFTTADYTGTTRDPKLVVTFHD